MSKSTFSSSTVKLDLFFVIEFFIITKTIHIQAFINITPSKSTPGSLLYNQVLTVTAKAAESGFQATVTFLPTSLMASYERR